MTRKIAFLSVVFILLASGCSASKAQEPTATQEIVIPSSTNTPKPTVTKTPTKTATPTVTATATATLTPTETATPTSTSTPTWKSPPRIVITGVSPKGTVNGIVMGMVYNVETSTHAVAVYIYVEGGWWVKPYWNASGYASATYIWPDGHWDCDIVTGGNDKDATEVIAFLIPKGFRIPQGRGGPLPINTGDFPYARVTRE